MGTSVFELQVIPTVDKATERGNGVFVPLWRDWDSQYAIDPKMVYFMTVKKGTRKGPHLHKKRTGYITCLSGKVSLILKQGGAYERVECDAARPTTVEILPGVGLLAINGGDEDALLLNICSPAWHPDDQDSYPADFSDFEADPVGRV